MTWTCIDEELPRAGETVIVSLQGGEVAMACLRPSGFWEVWSLDPFKDSPVMYWQNLPIPPQRPARQK